MTIDQARLRFRTTLKIDDVPALWEDPLFGEEERSAVCFRIGEVNFEGSNPCARRAVPPRDNSGAISRGRSNRDANYGHFYG